MSHEAFPPRAVLAFLAVVFFSPAGTAWAQSNSCQDILPLLEERKKIVAQINSWNKGGKKVDANMACSTARRLVANGDRALKWLADNKDWCSIPADFVSGFQKDQKQVSVFRTNACKAAAQAEKAEKEGGGMLGGGGLSGQYRIPQGAIN